MVVVEDGNRCCIFGRGLGSQLMIDEMTTTIQTYKQEEVIDACFGWSGKGKKRKEKLLMSYSVSGFFLFQVCF